MKMGMVFFLGGGCLEGPNSLQKVIGTESAWKLDMDKLFVWGTTVKPKQLWVCGINNFRGPVAFALQSLLRGLPKNHISYVITVGQ